MLAHAAKAHRHQCQDQAGGERRRKRPTPTRDDHGFAAGLVGERTQLHVVLEQLVEATYRAFGVGIGAPMIGARVQPGFEFLAVTPGAIRCVDARIPASRGIHYGFAVFTHEVHLAYDVASRLPPTFFMQTASARLMCFSTILTEIPQW